MPATPPGDARPDTARLGEAPIPPLPTPNSDATQTLACRATHAVRDLEESERLRQLGAIVVHDLNNALFALQGRLQLLRRRLDPAHAKAVDDTMESVRLIESQLALLHKACPRDEPESTRCPVRVALADALAGVARAWPGGPAALAGADAAVALLPESLEADAGADEIAAAVRQVASFHRARGASRLRIVARLAPASDRNSARLELDFEDDAGATAAPLEPPSLLSGTFALDTLALAAALRASREFGGKIAAEPTADGVRTRLSFEVMESSPSTASGMNATVAQGSTSRSAKPSSATTAPLWTPPANAGSGAGASANTAAFGVDSASKAPAHASSSRPASAAHAPLRILIADDDAGVRAVLIAVLEGGDHDVDATADPSEIGRRGDLGEFDVAVLDAGGGGLEALRELRARGERLPILLASGDDVRAEGDPFTRAAMKPFALDRLDALLRSLAALRPRG